MGSSNLSPKTIFEKRFSSGAFWARDLKLIMFRIEQKNRAKTKENVFNDFRWFSDNNIVFFIIGKGCCLG
jgi:hypothetical protein